MGKWLGNRNAFELMHPNTYDGFFLVDVMKRRKFQMATHAELIFVLPRRVSHFVGSRYAANLKNLTTSSTNPWVTATKIGLCRYYKKSRLELKIPRGPPLTFSGRGTGEGPRVIFNSSHWLNYLMRMLFGNTGLSAVKDK